MVTAPPPDHGRVLAMSRRTIPGLEAPDPVLEREVRARLDEVEAALEKAVRADSDMLAETARYLLDAGGKRFRPIVPHSRFGAAVNRPDVARSGLLHPRRIKVLRFAAGAPFDVAADAGDLLFRNGLSG